jgi:mitogen-activated protein kinase binding protein 1
MLQVKQGLASIIFVLLRASTWTTNGLLCFTGCIVVVYNPRQNKQVHFFRARQPVCALAVSRDGARVAAGQRGKTAAITVWNMTGPSVAWESLAHHVGGVAALAFSPDGRFLVSCGFKVDRSQGLAVWDLTTGLRAACGRLSQKVAAVTFAEDGGFVTAGERHLKFWQLRDVDSAILQQQTAVPDAKGATSLPVVIVSKPAVMRESGPQFEHFVDVCTGKSPRTAHLTYAISSAGVLCAFDRDRMMTLWVNTRVRAGFALDVAEDRLFIGGADGIVRSFHPETLEFISTLPLPAAVGRQNVRVGEAVPEPQAGDIYPGALCVRTAGGGSHVAVVYGDRSLYVWNCSNLEHVSKYRSSCGHSAAVQGVAMLPLGGTGQSRNASASRHPPLPAGTFVTCSSDATLRFWNLNPRATASSVALDAPAVGLGSSPAAAPAIARNLYSREQVLVVYANEKLLDPIAMGSPADAPRISGGGGTWPSRSVVNSTQDLEAAGGLVPPSVLLDTGLRCMAVSPGGDQVAAGDRVGGLRVFDIPSGQLRWACAAHTQEVLCVKYAVLSRPPSVSSEVQPAVASALILASGSHDKTLRLFLGAPMGGAETRSAFDSAALIAGTEGGGHASAVAAFVFSPDGQQLVSAGSDASLVSFRLAMSVSTAADDESLISATCVRTVRTTHGKIYDLAGDASGRNIVVAGPDRRVHVYAQRTCKLVRSFKPQADVAELNRVVLDPTGLFVAAAAFDRRVHIFDFFSGEPVCHLSGHSELVTGLAFTLDFKRLITVSGDGCIMVWRLGSQIYRAMADRWTEIAGPRAPPKVLAPLVGESVVDPRPQPAAVVGEEASGASDPRAQSSTIAAVDTTPLPVNAHGDSARDAAHASLLTGTLRSEAAPVPISLPSGVDAVVSPPVFRTSMLPEWAQEQHTGGGGATAATASVPARSAAPPPLSHDTNGTGSMRTSKWSHVLPAPAYGAESVVAHSAPVAAAALDAAVSPGSVHDAEVTDLLGALATQGSLNVSEDGDGFEADEDDGSGVDQPPDEDEGDYEGVEESLAAAEEVEEYPPDFHQPVEDTPATLNSFSVTRSAVFASALQPLALQPAQPAALPAVLAQQPAAARDRDAVVVEPKSAKDMAEDDAHATVSVLLSPLGTSCLATLEATSNDSIGAVQGGHVAQSELSFTVSASAAALSAGPVAAAAPQVPAEGAPVVPLAAFSGAIERLEHSIHEVAGLFQALSATVQGGGRSLDTSSFSAAAGDWTLGTSTPMQLQTGSAPGSTGTPGVGATVQPSLLVRSFLDSTRAAGMGALPMSVAGAGAGVTVPSPEVLTALRAALSKASSMLATLAGPE